MVECLNKSFLLQVMKMGLLLDAIVLSFLALFVLLSARKGFVRTFVGLIGTVAAVILAFVLSRALAEFVYTAFLRDPMVGIVENTLIIHAGDGAHATFDAVFENLPGFILQAASLYGISFDAVSSKIGTAIQDSAQQAAPAVADVMLKPILTGLISAIALVLLFVLLMMLVRVISRMLNKAVSIPLFGTANNILGGVVGLVKGCLVVFVVAAVLGLLIPFTQNGFLIFTDKAIESSFLFKAFYNLNPLI
ncbi:MAG TPA: hypothetical protein DEQ02_00735 [Ruminococcaceae bacterium]|nr:hypothetical protein [Oscillospiraceae bacterium]